MLSTKVDTMKPEPRIRSKRDGLIRHGCKSNYLPRQDMDNLESTRSVNYIHRCGDDDELLDIGMKKHVSSIWILDKVEEAMGLENKKIGHAEAEAKTMIYCSPESAAVVAESAAVVTRI
ncbi:hypothetical protein Tco_0031772 [Tanacetum coccineum]